MRNGIAVVMARNLIGLSQVELAASTKLSQGTMRKLELGKAISDKSLAKVLGWLDERVVFTYRGSEIVSVGDKKMVKICFK